MLAKFNTKIAKLVKFTLKEKSKIIPNLHVKKIMQYHQGKNTKKVHIIITMIGAKNYIIIIIIIIVTYS
jgi:ribosomal protein S19